MRVDHYHKRDWQEIAAEASHEKDSTRLIELTKELEHALDERDKELRKPDAKDQHA